jgi:hypothetical protein
MSDTTSIMDLPMDPTGGGTQNNISISSSEPAPSNNNNNNNISLDQTTISQIVNGLQQASISGATQLRSRDISMTTDGHTQDPYVQPNYVPPVQQPRDYIKDSDETNEEILNSYNQQMRNSNNLEDMYSEIQLPILMTTLYFLFQLPFFRRNLFSLLPFLFSTDGNYNINGYLFTSGLFGLIFYMLNKVITHFNKF